MEGSSNIPVINFDLINPPSYHPKDGVIPNRNQYGDVNTPSHLRKRTDKSRMPKLAAVLLIAFFSTIWSISSDIWSRDRSEYKTRCLDHL